MLVILISWLCIGGSAYLWGLLSLKLFEKTERLEKKHFALIIFSGICLLTVYAQIYSLFSGVGMAALSVVLLADLLILIFNRKELLCDIIACIRSAGIWKAATVVICGVLVLKISAELIYNPDTYLYHSQAIHWIEDYGAVKGLGNIHSRFAFNSSFLCLQALFSFRGFYARSLHSVNGFLAWIMISYSLCSMKIWKTKKLALSDFLKICLLVFESLNVSEFSSPGTDLFAHSLSIFIICEWIGALEDDERGSSIFVLLSIFCVFALTLKLSSALLVLLAVFPAMKLIQAKKIKPILLYCFAGLIVLVPFLIRNIILSGYLLYPLEQLDLFNVEWKMPAETVWYERYRTASWAREIFGIIPVNSPIADWFPYWFSKQSAKFIVLLAADILSCAALIGYGILRVKRDGKWEWLHLASVITACFAYWFFAAPHIRFGRPYILIPPFLLTGLLLSKTGNKYKLPSAVCLIIAIGFCCKPILGILKSAKSVKLFPISCVDYTETEGTEIKIQGLSFYISDDPSPDYYLFPAIPKTSVDSVEPMGKTYSAGFKAKK